MKKTLLTGLAALAMTGAAQENCYERQGAVMYQSQDNWVYVETELQVCGNDAVVRMNFDDGDKKWNVQVWDENSNGYRQNEEDRILIAGAQTWFEVDGLEARTSEGANFEMDRNAVRKMYLAYQNISRMAISPRYTSDLLNANE